jgi:hypothetical protein
VLGAVSGGPGASVEDQARRLAAASGRGETPVEEEGSA